MSEFNILREKYSSRGGGIEIDLTPFGYEGERMYAYRDYLGGGIIGRVQNDCTILFWEDDDALCELADELNQYYYLRQVDMYDEYELLD